MLLKNKSVEGLFVAKHNRYRQLESLMAKVLGGNALLFILYLVFARQGWAVVKYIAGILSLLVSCGSLGWLYLIQELPKRRSLWMVVAAGGLGICVLISMLLHYPCPPVVG